MKKQKRLLIYSCIIISGFLLFNLYSYLGTKMWGLQFPWNSFLFSSGDRFMDFYNINHMVASLNPYSQGSSYPPFALLIAYLFARLIPGTADQQADTIKGSSLIGKVSIYALYSGCIFIIFILICRRIWGNRIKENLSSIVKQAYPLRDKILCILMKLFMTVAVTLSIILAGPVIFAFDRGNYLILCVLFLVLFCLYFDKFDYLAAVFLALAACLKIFPLALFFLFVHTRKWKPLGLGLLVCVTVTTASASIFKGGIVVNLMGFVRNLKAFTGTMDDNIYGFYRYATGLRNFFATPLFAIKGHIPVSLHIGTLSMVAGVILLIMVIIMCLMDKRIWRQIIYLSFFMVLFPSPSYYYNLAYLVGPILLFLFKEEEDKLDWLFLIGLGLLMIPKNYYYFAAHFSIADDWVGVDCLINPMIMCLLLGISMLELIYIRRSNVKKLLLECESEPEGI